MNRNQIFATLEFIDDQIRLTVGEYHQDKFHIFDTFTTVSKGYKDGQIHDEAELSKSINTLTKLASETTQIECEDIIFCLPSYNLLINQTTCTTAVFGKNSLIGNDDINNALRTASRVRHDPSQKIMDLVPIEFTLDNNQVLDFTPLGYKSATFKTLFNILTLPKDLVDSFKRVIEACKLNIKDYYFDINCLYAGAIIEDELDVAILDLSKNATKLLIFRKGKLLQRYHLDYGIKKIINNLEKTYNIDNKNATSLLLINGNTLAETAHNHSIFLLKEDNNTKYLKEKEFARLVKEEVNKLLKELVTKASKTITDNSLDIVITGYGSIIKNIDQTVKSLFNCDTSISQSKTLGLTNPNNCQTLGLIKLNAKNAGQTNYKNLQKENKNDIIEIDEDIINSGEFKKFVIDDDEFDEEEE